MLGSENRLLVAIVPSARDPSAPGLRPVAQDDRRVLMAGSGRWWPSFRAMRSHVAAVAGAFG